jgi:hypothetical protein
MSPQNQIRLFKSVEPQQPVEQKPELKVSEQDLNHIMDLKGSSKELTPGNHTKSHSKASISPSNTSKISRRKQRLMSNEDKDLFLKTYSIFEKGQTSLFKKDRNEESYQEEREDTF